MFLIQNIDRVFIFFSVCLSNFFEQKNLFFLGGNLSSIPLFSHQIAYDHLQECGEGDGEEDTCDTEEARHDGHHEEDEEWRDIEGSTHNHRNYNIPFYLLNNDIEDCNSNNWNNTYGCSNGNSRKECNEGSDIGDEFHHTSDECKCDNPLKSDAEYPEDEKSHEGEGENRERKEELSADPERDDAEEIIFSGSEIGGCGIRKNLIEESLYSATFETHKERENHNHHHLENPTGEGRDERFGSWEEIICPRNNNPRERCGLTSEEFKERTKIDGCEVGLDERRERKSIDTTRFIESLQGGKRMGRGCEEERNLFHKYRDDRKSGNEEEEKDEEKYEDNTQEIRNMSFSQPIKKWGEKNGQKSGEKENGEDGGQEWEEVESSHKEENNEDFNNKGSDILGYERWFFIHNRQRKGNKCPYYSEKPRKYNYLSCFFSL